MTSDRENPLLKTGGAALLLLFVIFTALSFSERERIQHFFTHYSLPLIAFTVFLWLLSLVRLARETKATAGHFVVTHWQGLAAAILLTAAAGLLADSSYKVLGDEAVILNTARAMTLERTAQSYREGIYTPGGEYSSLTSITPKRPLLFPYLVHLLHRTTGLRWQNAYHFNLAVFFCFLLFTFAAARRFFDLPASLAAMLLGIASPLVLLCARSALVDLFSTFWFLLSLAALSSFLASATPARFSFLVTTLLMFAHIRYENVLFSGIILLGIALLRRLKLRYLRESFPFVASTPLLLLPLFWQFYLKRGGYTITSADSLFGVGSFLRHGKILLAAMVGSGSGLSPFFSRAAFPLFLLTAVVLVAALLGRKVSPPGGGRRDFLVLAGWCLGLHLLIVLSHYRGDIHSLVAQRFFLTPFVVFGLAPLGLLLLPGRKVRGWHLLLLSGLLLLLSYPPVLRRWKAVPHYRGVEIQREVMAGRDHRSSLAVTDQPVYLTALGYGSIGITNARENREFIANYLHGHGGREVLFFRYYDRLQEKPLDGYELEGDYLLEPLESFPVLRSLSLDVLAVRPRAMESPVPKSSPNPSPEKSLSGE
jgi:hypothetical protein